MHHKLKLGKYTIDLTTFYKIKNVIKEAIAKFLAMLVRMFFGFIIGALLGLFVGMVIGLISWSALKGEGTLLEFIISMAAVGAFIGTVIGSSNLLNSQSTGKPRYRKGTGNERHDRDDGR
jgi:hypothetical protein